ncbi:MAG: hypothetical protein AB1606_05400 [Nitrospirota bacterium]
MRKKNSLLITLSLSLIIFIFSSVFPEDTKNFQFKKQPEIQQVKPKKPVKIKLRRSAEDKYTWELTGDDVDEIVKTDRRLRKLLKIE